MAAFLQFAFFTAALVAAYYFWIRPILRSRPAFADFYATADGLWAAVRERFAGIKGKLAAAIGMAASGVVYRCCRIGRGRSMSAKAPNRMICTTFWCPSPKWFRALTDRRAVEER